MLALSAALAACAGCGSTGGGRSGGRGPKSAFSEKRKKKKKAAPQIVIRASERMAADLEIPLPHDPVPETHRAPENPEPVVCKVVRVTDGGAKVVLQVPEYCDLIAGEELSIFMTIGSLPRSRYIKDHKKELYLARAVVVQGGEGECIAEVSDYHLEGPVKPGDLAIARGY